MPKSQNNEVDPRNKLNDLSNREWMISTKSVWWSMPKENQEIVFTDDDRKHFIQWLIDLVGEETAAILLDQLFPSILLSTPPARDTLKKKHPATFAENDIEKLILFFSKQNDYVLDPFVGSGSTLVSCINTNRNGLGIELVPRWANIARKRAREGDLPLFRNLEVNNFCKQEVIEGDARIVLKNIDPQTFDFIVTSPPYWNILQKDKDHKATQERVNHGLETKYSEMKSDLGNLPSYNEFLEQLGVIFSECLRVLKKNKYMTVIVSDFRDKGEFYTFHSDIQNIIEAAGFKIQGITILAQDNKNLYPYGVPYAFVSNINHQYILIFQKK